MSAFLGPIHHWLYHKINLQDKLTEAYLASAAEAGFPEVREKVDATFGTMPEGSLETIIDESNIHGWLQEKIHFVEKRYALTVTELLAKKPEAIDRLSQIAYEFGQKNSTLTKENTAKDAYQVLNDTLIDGMPCDHVNMVLDASENDVAWRRTQCVHEDFWTAVGGDVNVYYQLRMQLIRGMLSPTSLTFDAEVDQFRIYK